MNREKDLRAIKEFWEAKAKEHGVSHKSSWEDRFCMGLEVGALAEYIEDGDRVLDIGCGNGLSTLDLVLRKKVSVKGIDYSEEMIRAAEGLCRESTGKGLRGTVSFEVGDIMNLREEEHSYTRAMTRRVIINLGSLENQIEAARQVHRVLVPGGLFLMSEATTAGLRRINALRAEFGLEDLEQPWFNLYIDEGEFAEKVSDIFDLVEIRNFSSTYYVGSRVLQPFVKRILSVPPDYDSEINRLFAGLPAWGDYGIQKLFLFRKR